MILSQVIDRLVVIFGTATSVSVFDGPKPSSVNKGDFVLVGSDGTDEDGASAALEPSATGAGDWWDELGEVTCSAWSWSGGTDIAARRAAALSVASDCIDALRFDRTLGGLLITPGATSGDLRYEARQSDTGALVRVSFTVAYQALVTS